MPRHFIPITDIKDARSSDYYVIEGEKAIEWVAALRLVADRCYIDKYNQHLQVEAMYIPYDNGDGVHRLGSARFIHYLSTPSRCKLWLEEEFIDRRCGGDRRCGRRGRRDRRKPD